MKQLIEPPSWITKEQLISLYIDQLYTKAQVAEKYQVSICKVSQALQYFNIKASQEQIKQKINNTNLKKYGTTNPNLLPSIKNKIKNTLQSKYGVDNVMFLPETKEKLKQTNLKKYGVEYPWQNTEVYQKVLNTNITRYGTEHPGGLPEKVQQSIEVKIAKYGGVGFGSQITNKKIQHTIQQKYGVTNAMFNEEIKEKVKQTTQINYGVENCSQSVEIKQKKAQTIFKNYGCFSPLQNPKIYSKLRATNVAKYGAPYYNQKNISSDILNLVHNKNNLKNWLLQFQDPPLGLHELAEKLGCNYLLLQRSIKTFQLQHLVSFHEFSSLREKQLRDYCLSLGLQVVCNNREILGGQEIDIVIKKKNIGIEYNGVYWHSINFVDAKYHQNKSLLALSRGVFIIHVWENETDTEIYNKIMLNCKEVKIDTSIEQITLNFNYENPLPFLNKGYIIKEITEPDIISENPLVFGAGFITLVKQQEEIKC